MKLASKQSITIRIEKMKRREPRLLAVHALSRAPGMGIS